MTTMRVIRSAQKERAAGRKKMTISVLGSDTKIIVPYAPREVTHSSLAPEWEEVRRTGREPLTLKSNTPMRRMSFKLTFGGLDWTTRFDGELRKLMSIAQSKKRVQVSYGSWESGIWHVSSLSFGSVLRHPDTNEITRAEVDIEFIRSSSAEQKLGPLTGGVKEPATGGSKKHNKGRDPKKYSGKPRTYQVKKGDTLTKIAVEFYHDAGMWRKIADANKIRNPRKLKPGKFLRLP